MLTFAWLYICNIYIYKRPRLAFERRLDLEANWFITTRQIKDIHVPHALENLLMMFDPQNYECLIPLNKGFFQGHFGLTRCILFHSFHSWKSMQLVRPKWPFKKLLFHGNLTFIVFFVPSLTFFIMNVEKIHSFRFLALNYIWRGSERLEIWPFMKENVSSLF